MEFRIPFKISVFDRICKNYEHVHVVISKSKCCHVVVTRVEEVVGTHTENLRVIMIILYIQDMIFIFAQTLVRVTMSSYLSESLISSGTNGGILRNRNFKI